MIEEELNETAGIIYCYIDGARGPEIHLENDLESRARKSASDVTFRWMRVKYRDWERAKACPIDILVRFKAASTSVTFLVDEFRHQVR